MKSKQFLPLHVALVLLLLRALCMCISCIFVLYYEKAINALYELAKELPDICLHSTVYHSKMGKFRLVPFPRAPQVNLPACSPHCPFNTERQAGKL